MRADSLSNVFKHEREMCSTFCATICSNYSPPDENCLRLRCNVIEQQQQKFIRIKSINLVFSHSFFAWFLTSFMMRTDKVIRSHSNVKLQIKISKERKKQKYVVFFSSFWCDDTSYRAHWFESQDKRYFISFCSKISANTTDTLAMNFRFIRIEDQLQISMGMAMATV